MSCTDSLPRYLVLASALALAACTAPRMTTSPAPPSSTPATAAARAALDISARPRNWEDYRVRAGQRMVAASPQVTYLSEVPEPLLAIPILDVELNSDGSVRRINIKRVPSQAEDTVQIAIDAVRRGAPYGDVSHLPRPWVFTEVFLFRDDRRFKPRSLDL